MRVVHDEKQGRSLGEVGGNPVQPMEHASPRCPAPPASSVWCAGRGRASDARGPPLRQAALRAAPAWLGRAPARRAGARLRTETPAPARHPCPEGPRPHGSGPWSGQGAAPRSSRSRPAPPPASANRGPAPRRAAAPLTRPAARRVPAGQPRHDDPTSVQSAKPFGGVLVAGQPGVRQARRRGGSRPIRSPPCSSGSTGRHATDRVHPRGREPRAFLLGVAGAAAGAGGGTPNRRLRSAGGNRGDPPP